MKEATIYVIRNIASGSVDGCYVGSTVRLERARRAAHLSLLRKGAHHSIRLQGAFNKYGEAAFVFETIETCPVDQRLARENYWISKLQPRYNVLPVAGSPEGYSWKLSAETRAKMSQYALNRPKDHRDKLKVARASQVVVNRKLGERCFPGWHHTEESKAKISDAIRRRGPMPDEVKKKISRATKGKKVSPETCAKISAAAKKRVVTEDRLHLLRTVNIGRKYRPETLAKRSKSMLAAYANDPTLKGRIAKAISEAKQRKKASRETES